MEKGVIDMAPTKGIDISQYQGKPDFAKVKSSVDAVDE
jgi:GH25 family lysozyme M1 (1,4-beta-N-acetylmuramidase)